MSLILDALNRSRHDSDPVPGIGTRHDADLVPSTSSWRQYIPWGGLLLALLIIAALLVEREESTIEQVATLSPAPATPEPSRSTPGGDREAGAQAVTPSQLPVQAPDPAPVVAAGAGPEVGVPATSPAPEEAPAPSETVDPEVARLYQRPSVEATGTTRPSAGKPAAKPGAEQVLAPSPAVQEEQQIDLEQMVRQAQEEMENARLAEHSAPFISELSQQTKNDIPTVYYQRHDYSGVSGQSKVVLNGESVGPGGSPAPGMKVVEILPDSVVLNYRGTEFRLRALNSWVNL